jgi:hypothetical protein
VAYISCNYLEKKANESLEATYYQMEEEGTLGNYETSKAGPL